MLSTPYLYFWVLGVFGVFVVVVVFLGLFFFLFGWGFLTRLSKNLVLSKSITQLLKACS